MELIDIITSKDNLNKAYQKVVSNKGASGVDKMEVTSLFAYLKDNKEELTYKLNNKKYKPQPVKRVYIPKSNGKQRPLGIPTVLDRMVQQAIAQPITQIYESVFSDNSYGFRPNRSCHQAINKALEYLNNGYEWVIDIDIEQFFDKVNHDKLIQILRKQVNDSKVLYLVSAFLKAGIMEKGIVKSSTIGVPQGGPLSVVLSNIYLDELDKELESRGLNFVRYADDCNIFVKSELAANRVIKSITSWIERKLFLKVNVTKTKVVRPTQSNFLGFTFTKQTDKWEVKPTNTKKKDLYNKIRLYLKRNKAITRPLATTFRRLNQMIIGWINYFRIGKMKIFIKQFGEWLRHKVRVVIIKQWKNPRTIIRNLTKINNKYKNGFNEESIYKVGNSRLGWYKKCGMNVVNFILNPKLLETKIKDRPGLVNPLFYYSK